MATYQELVAQKAELDAQIEEARKAEVSSAVDEVKRLGTAMELLYASSNRRTRFAMR